MSNINIFQYLRQLAVILIRFELGDFLNVGAINILSSLRLLFLYITFEKIIGLVKRKWFGVVQEIEKKLLTYCSLLLWKI